METEKIDSRPKRETTNQRTIQKKKKPFVGIVFLTISYKHNLNEIME